MSSDSLSCSWEHPELLEEHYISGYTLAYRLADGFDYYPGYGTELARIDLNPSSIEYTIDGLRPYAGYIIELTCEISVETGSGQSGDSQSGDSALMMSIEDIDNFTSISSIVSITQPISKPVCKCRIPLF